MGVDVGRYGCNTEVVILKVTPNTYGTTLKQVVNIFSYEEDHFGYQSIKIKRLFRDFKCNICVVDGNGLVA